MTQTSRRRGWGKGNAKVVSREMCLASAQVTQYSHNSLIKQRAKPRQTPLDFSLAQKSRAAARPRSRSKQSVHQPSKLCKVLCIWGCQSIWLVTTWNDVGSVMSPSVKADRRRIKEFLLFSWSNFQRIEWFVRNTAKTFSLLSQTVNHIISYVSRLSDEITCTYMLLPYLNQLINETVKYLTLNYLNHIYYITCAVDVLHNIASRLIPNPSVSIQITPKPRRHRNREEKNTREGMNRSVKPQKKAEKPRHRQTNKPH